MPDPAPPAEGEYAEYTVSSRDVILTGIRTVTDLLVIIVIVIMTPIVMVSDHFIVIVIVIILIYKDL